MDKIASPSTVIPLLLLLILIIYYLMSLTGALREANEDLRNQLRRERQEERRKMLQRVVNAKLDDSGGNNAIDRWRKVLEASSPLTPNVPGQTSADAEEEKIKARREFLARIMKKALRKSSNTSEDESQPGADEDETDTEQHESLPHDQEGSQENRTAVKRKTSKKNLLDDKTDETTKARKSSFARMRDIVETNRKKSEQSSEEKSAKPTPTTEEEEQEEVYNKARVVSERRSLRRQQSTQESDGTASLPTAAVNASSQDITNYEVVNEKNKATERKSKTMRKLNTDPEIFKFDKNVYNKRDNCEQDESDDDHTSYKEIVIRPKKDKVIVESSAPLKSPQPPEARHKTRAKVRITNNSSPEERKNKTPTPTGHTEEASGGNKSKASSPTEKSKPNDEILKQPMKKLNSFLALVREAVQAKKNEQAQIESQSTDLQSRVKTYIDDSVSISEDGSLTRTSDSIASSQQSKYGSLSRKRGNEPPKPKREDSQASIWSDNIPVITISKTESNECILEKQSDEGESDDQVVNDKADDPSMTKKH